jgi:hypothetical protein
MDLARSSTALGIFGPVAGRNHKPGGGRHGYYDGGGGSHKGHFDVAVPNRAGRILVQKRLTRRSPLSSGVNTIARRSPAAGWRDQLDHASRPTIAVLLSLCDAFWLFNPLVHVVSRIFVSFRFYIWTWSACGARTL